MNSETHADELWRLERPETAGCQSVLSSLDRRSFVQAVGAGWLVTATDALALGQSRRSRGRKPIPISARLHFGQDGTITVLTGKVEVGQGARTEITQAAAEELRVPVDGIRLVMADTDRVPDDGTTAGSRTTPATIPLVRKAAAMARKLLIDRACQRWNVDPSTLELRNGEVIHVRTKQRMTYAKLVEDAETAKLLQQNVADDVSITPVSDWKVLGTSVSRPNRRELVTGAHRFPSDIVRSGMLYGSVVRPPSYGATLVSVDMSVAEAMEDVVVVHEGDFIGCAAPTSWQARKAVELLSKTAVWKTIPQTSSRELFSYLKEHARTGNSGSGRSRGRGNFRSRVTGSVPDALTAADKVLRATYEVAYVQHAPMEPRAAVAEWHDGKLTVWTGSQAPTRVRQELAETLHLPSSRVRVIIPDTGGGFGGKHTGEVAVEAARLAQAAGRAVSLRWSREEEFTWAYFRPAALIEVQAAIDDGGTLIAWDFSNINSGASAIESPYHIPNTRTRYLASDPPLRQGSYRCLAATANTFAREAFLDEIAAAAGVDPLTFRLQHLTDSRLRAVLQAAADRFEFQQRHRTKTSDTGVGLACGTEKGSYVAACAEVSVDRQHGTVNVHHVCEAFECGAIQNPKNLTAQVESCILMGLGAALREEITFADGRVLNASFRQYRVPRFRDVPMLDVQLLDRPDLPSAGGGETPIIAIAPAVANAILHATGSPVRSMPIRLKAEGGKN